MSDGIGDVSLKNLRRALARQAYHTGSIRLNDGDISGAECLVASRQGLFAVDRAGYRTSLFGQFFGMALHRDSLYVFEACDRTHAPTKKGRINRLKLTGETLAEPEVLCDGLDNGCHQIAFIDDDLYVVDTYQQALQVFDRNGRFIETLHPVPAALGSAEPRYAHMNSMCVVGNQIQLMLHNGVMDTARPSEILVFDKKWNLLDRFAIDGFSCHDILPLDDGQILHCGSRDGELIGSGGLKQKLSSNMTRGLAATETAIMVGTSEFVERANRVNARGSVIFLDRSFERQIEVAVPGAPTCIVSLSRKVRGDVS